MDVSLQPVGGVRDLFVAPRPETFDWLRVQATTTDSRPGSIRSTAQLRVMVLPTGLPNGTYRGTITAYSGREGAPTVSVVIAVTFTVSGGSAPSANPTILISPTELSFATDLAGVPPAKSLNITSSIHSAIPVNLTTNVPWLSVSPNTASTPAYVNVGINTNGLGVGTHSGQVTVRTTGTANPMVVIPVLVTIAAPTPSTPTVFPNQLTFRTGEAGVSPPSQTIQVNNDMAVNFEASASEAWLKLSKSSGTTPSTVVVDVVDTGLPTGTYTGTIRIGFSSSSVLIPVSWTIVRSSLKWSVSDSNLTIHWQRGSPLPATMNVAVSTGASERPRLARNSAGWLLAYEIPESGLTVLTLRPLAAALTTLGPGTYSGVIEMQATGIVPPTLLIPTQIKVSNEPFPNVSSKPFVFSYAPGGELPPNQSRPVTPAAAGLDLAVSVTGGGSWLEVSLDRSASPAKLLVRTQPAQLGTGDYAATINVRSGSNTVEIPVALRVTTQPRIRVAPQIVELSARLGTVQQMVQVTSTQAPVQYALTPTVFPEGSRYGIVAGTAERSTPGQVMVRGNPEGQPPGTYTSSVFILAPKADNPLVEVPVEFTVQPATVIEAQPIQFTFPITAGEVSTARNKMRLNTATSVPYKIELLTGGRDWLSVTPMEGMTNSDIELSLTPLAATLRPGGYGATIHFLSGGVSAGAGYALLTVGEARPTPLVSSVVNAATYQGGAVAPGMLVTLAGTNFGPTDGVFGQVVGPRFATTAGGCSTTFSGLAAPMLYANATQINAVVPYGVSGRTTSEVIVQCGAMRSQPFSVGVEASVPGIFTVDGAQAAAFNEDGLYNSPSQPARAGSIMTVFATGEGVVTPGAQDGEVISATALRRPVAPVLVRVNGVELPAGDVLYAGSAPGLVSGLMQVNFRLPASVTNQTQAPLELWVGSRRSVSGVTIAIR